MSELILKNDNRVTIRWKLLTGASALALTVASIGVARAEDTDHPQLWIELGGQIDRLDASEAKFAPPFILATPRPGPETVDPLSVGHTPRWSFGEDAKLTFQPEDSSWLFSASIRYGRSSANKGLHQQSYPTRGIPRLQPPPTSSNPTDPRKAQQFIDAQEQTSESHTILDFQAGKDVGLGMFGAGSSSIFNFGVRFAQFASKSNAAFKSDPDAHPTYKYFYNKKFHLGGIYHFNAATVAATRSFRGVGPSISWNASTPAFGDPQAGQVALDWGVNAALLFGRQRAKVHHQTTGQYHKGKYGTYNRTNPFRTTLYRNAPPDKTRSRTAVVPNIGGFAGVSFRYADAKLSLGYRADFFFGAMDGGIDTRKSTTRGFYGPFASVSVGLGD